MLKKHSIAAALAASLALGPVTAHAGDAFVGGLVGGIIGGAIANGATKKRTVYRSTGVSSATRQANRETQTALNYFGFNAGTPDGVMGSRSRSAVSNFQAHMSYPITGRIQDYERTFLMGAYYWAQSGGPSTAELIASNGQGVRGLLHVYRDEQTGGTSASVRGNYGLPREVAKAVNEIAKSSDPSAEQLVQRHGFIQLADLNADGQTDYIIDTSVTGSAFWCNAQSCAVRVFASIPGGYQRNDFQAFNVTPASFNCMQGTCRKTDGGTQMAVAPAPQVQPQQPQTQMAAAPVPSAQPAVKAPTFAAAAPSPAVPNFFGGGGAAASLESHCNKVNLLTSANGFITQDNMTDGGMAMAEQMCLTRTYAIAEGEDMMAKVPNVTTAQIAEQCAGFGQTLKEHVSAVSLQPREEVMRGVSSFVLSSGMSPQQLEATAKICLSSGYRTDDMDTAIGSALLLVALGNAPYSELLGHHLSQGFGATERLDLAADWYSHALNALESGTTPVFTPGQPERTELLRKASMMMNGSNNASAGQAGASSVPVFTIK